MQWSVHNKIDEMKLRYQLRNLRVQDFKKKKPNDQFIMFLRYD